MKTTYRIREITTGFHSYAGLDESTVARMAASSRGKTLGWEHSTNDPSALKGMLNWVTSEWLALAEKWKITVGAYTRVTAQVPGLEVYEYHIRKNKNGFFVNERKKAKHYEARVLLLERIIENDDRSSEREIIDFIAEPTPAGRKRK